MLQCQNTYKAHEISLSLSYAYRQICFTVNCEYCENICIQRFGSLNPVIGYPILHTF